MHLPVITNESIKKLNPYCFLIYSDNILESINILDLLSNNNSFLEIIGVSYEPIDQPIYLFKEKNKERHVIIGNILHISRIKAGNKSDKSQSNKENNIRVCYIGKTIHIRKKRMNK